jgi:hypothetical protein
LPAWASLPFSPEREFETARATFESSRREEGDSLKNSLWLKALSKLREASTNGLLAFQNLGGARTIGLKVNVILLDKTSSFKHCNAPI